MNIVTDKKLLTIVAKSSIFDWGSEYVSGVYKV